ncbi:hypothetical protein TSAR_004559 [Trichomalopsis sarcophagae]|uniref:Uncharacterized protein n=1 Tax=Trichomalopsis sarcophagae TaxID=543379 RepID=A0A232EL99_9HYME|nr:hypothetical protein TSAR_004559 [Trichomalopsis sarcophagae]
MCVCVYASSRQSASVNSIARAPVNSFGGRVCSAFHQLRSAAKHASLYITKSFDVTRACGLNPKSTTGNSRESRGKKNAFRLSKYGILTRAHAEIIHVE